MLEIPAAPFVFKPHGPPPTGGSGQMRGNEKKVSVKDTFLLYNMKGTGPLYHTTAGVLRFVSFDGNPFGCSVPFYR